MAKRTARQTIKQQLSSANGNMTSAQNHLITVLSEVGLNVEGVDVENYDPSILEQQEKPLDYQYHITYIIALINILDESKILLERINSEW